MSRNYEENPSFEEIPPYANLYKYLYRTVISTDASMSQNDLWEYIKKICMENEDELRVLARKVSTPTLRDNGKDTGMIVEHLYYTFVEEFY